MKIHKKLKKIDYSKIVDPGVNPIFYKGMTGKILEYLENAGPSSFSTIIANAGGGERRVIRLLDQMVNLGIIAFTSPNFSIPDLKISQGYSVRSVICPSCDSFIVNIHGELKQLLIFMQDVIKARPKATFIYDQRPVNAETIIRRVAYAIWRGDIQNKRVVLLGDDDLTSIAFAKTGLAEEIVVFDIDDRITNLIKAVAKANKLNIKTVKQDLLKELPKSFVNRFDTFITDPTPTVKPLTLFTGKGIELLKTVPGKAGYVFLYPSHAPMTVDYQKELSKMNVLITDCVPFFNQYEIIYHTLTENDIALMKKYDAYNKSISFYEYLMRVETMENSKVLPKKYSPADLIGKATKQVLEDPSKDPTLSDTNVAKSIRNSTELLKKLVKKIN